VKRDPQYSAWVTMKKFYRILEVAYDAPFEEVRQAYRDLVHVWHPDRFVHNERLQRMASQRLAAINEAYSHIRSMHVGCRDDEDFTTERDDLIDWSCRTMPITELHTSVNDTPKKGRRFSQWHWPHAVFASMLLLVVFAFPPHSTTGERHNQPRTQAEQDSANANFARMLGFQLPTDGTHFSVGSTRDDVISLHGAPSTEVLQYGGSSVVIERNVVKSWTVAPSNPLFAIPPVDTAR
jgi:hypothetical protein